jgi:hypothetical protein
MGSPLAGDTLNAIAAEHESLANLYEQVSVALDAGPGGPLSASVLLDELVEQVANHFSHEEEGGYYSQVVEIAPWRAPAVDELKRQHSDLLRTVARIAQGARLASKSLLSYEAVWKEFAEFLHSCSDHEARENRLVQEVYLLDIAAAD